MTIGRPFARSVEAIQESGDAWGLALADWLPGGVLLLRDRYDEAIATLERSVAQLFGMADGVRREIGVGVWLPDRPTHERTESLLRAALDGHTFEMRFAEGTQLSVSDALDIAVNS